MRQTVITPYNFFQIRGATPSGYGEGEELIGSASIATDSNGNAALSVTLPAVAAGSFITSTATDAANNTSEFSECIQRLNIGVAGSGSVAVGGASDGVICYSDCSAFFPPQTTVSLSAIPGTASFFSGFDGDPDCMDRSVTIDAVKTCTATFTSCADTKLAQIGANQYVSLDEAYQAASADPSIITTIELAGFSALFPSGYDFAAEKRVILMGGLNCEYAPVAGSFTWFLGGPFTISKGEVTVDGIVIL